MRRPFKTPRAFVRVDDWPERLSELLESEPARTLDYGEHDCALFGFEVLDALTGSNLRAEWRGTYQTLDAGLKRAEILHGARTLLQLADKHLRRVHPAHAHRGDLALVREPTEPGGRPVAAIFVVDDAYLRGIGGVILPRDRAKVCWAVG